MPDERIIIIGGGLAGVTSFYELAARQFPVVLMDGEDDVARGASYANGGVLHPSLPDPWNNPSLLVSLFDPLAPMKLHARQLPTMMGWGMRFLRNASPARHRAISKANFELAQYSTRQTDALRDALKLKFDAAAPGTLKVFRNKKQRDMAVALADMLVAQGLVYEVLDRDALSQREPMLANAHDNIAGALYFPDDRVGNARLFCEALTRAAIKQGGALRTGQKVERIMVENGRVVGVQVGAEIMRGQVVLCTGAAAPQLARPLGVRLPIRPAKGYSITLDSASLGDKKLRHPIVDPQLHIALTPLADKIRILGMAEFIGMDTECDPRRLAVLRAFFERLVPDVAATLDWAAADNWAGLRPMSSDGRPFIGATHIDGLWLNCGHGHLGWTMAVGSARVLVDQMTGAECAINAAPFAYDSRQRRLRI